MLTEGSSLGHTKHHQRSKPSSPTNAEDIRSSFCLECWKPIIESLARTLIRSWERETSRNEISIEVHQLHGTHLQGSTTFSNSIVRSHSEPLSPWLRRQIQGYLRTVCSWYFNLYESYCTIELVIMCTSRKGRTWRWLKQVCVCFLCVAEASLTALGSLHWSSYFLE